MFYPRDPDAVRREYEERLAAARRRGRHPQEQSVSLDFTDYDQQRYLAIGAARESRKVQAVTPARRHLWTIIRGWLTGGWARLGPPHRG